MKRLLFSCFLLLILTACSKEENEKEVENNLFPIEDLVGSWAYDTITYKGETGLYPHQEDCYKDHFIIRHNEGNWNDFTETIFLDANCANQGTNLEWELKGDVLNLYFGDQLVVTYQLLEVNPTTMSYRYMVDVDNDGRQDELIFNSVWYDPYDQFER